MSIHQPITSFVEAQPTDLVPAAQKRNRSFDLHPALFALTVGAYLTYLGVMGATFANREMILPISICGIIVSATFVVPALWARTEGPKSGPLPNWSIFMLEGIDTYTGHLSGLSAAAQVLIMPIVILGWGVAIAIIHAAVS